MSDPGCERYQELASARADGELGAGDLLALERHLDACPACRAFGAGVGRLRDLLHAAEAIRPLPRPPAGFAAAVAARAAAERAGALVAFPPRPRPRAWIGIAAAAAAVALLFGWSLQRLVPPGDGPPVAAVAPEPAPGVRTASASLDDLLRRHAMQAREGTMLGSAEEIEFAAFSGGRR